MTQTELTENNTTAKDLRIATLAGINSKLIGMDNGEVLDVVRGDNPDGYGVVMENGKGMFRMAKGLGSKEVQSFLDGYLAAL